MWLARSRPERLHGRRHPVRDGRETALRYDRMVAALGGHGEWVTDVAELGPAFERAVAAGLPSCINVGVDPFAPHPGFW